MARRTLLGLSLAAGLFASLAAGPLAAGTPDAFKSRTVREGHLALTGEFVQGGTLIGKVEPGVAVRLDNRPVKVAPSGDFVVGFDRDYQTTAFFELTLPDGKTERHDITVAKRRYDIQRVEGVPQKTVTPSAEDLKRIARDKARKEKAHETPVDGTWFKGDFIWPRQGIISGVFGSQRIYNGTPRSPHYGVDIAADTGDEVVAPQAGVVTLAFPDMFFEGGLIFIDHGLGYTSYFMHLSRLDVKAGDVVKQGQVIGAVGSTGRATGPHLHWGMYWNGQRLDPALRAGPMPEQQAKAP